MTLTLILKKKLNIPFFFHELVTNHRLPEVVRSSYQFLVSYLEHYLYLLFYGLPNFIHFHLILKLLRTYIEFYLKVLYFLREKFLLFYLLIK